MLQDTVPAPRRPSRRTLIVLSFFIILLVAAALRFVWIDRVPIGWHHDEALMGVMAGQVYRGEDRPIFFQQYLGQEPLYIYLSAGAIALFGGSDDFTPLRVTSAVVGLATAVMAFFLGRALFSTRVGLLAMALLATSFWQVMSARMAYRSITQPLLEAIAVYLLWQTHTRRHWGWAAGAGAALGATLYTYLGARVFPGVFVGFAVWLLVTRGLPDRRALIRAGLIAGVAALIVAPLAWFFLTNPGTFSARMEQVYVLRPEVNGGRPLELIADSTSKMLRSFTMSGEPMWRYNIPGRPMFVGALALAFYGGLALLLRRLFRRDDASALVLIWMAAMLFPGLLSWEAGAYTLRAMGLVPAVFLIPALALDRLARWLAERWRWGAVAATAGLVALLATDAVWTARDYFAVWATNFGASSESHADVVAQARHLATAVHPGEEEIFVAGEYYHNPILAQLARPVYSDLRWFDGRQSVVYSPQAERPSHYVLAFNGLPPDPDTLFPRSARIAAEPFAEGVDGGDPPPLFVAYRLTPEQVREKVAALQTDPRLAPVAGNLPGVLEPLGARMENNVGPGTTARVTFLWRVTGTLPPGEYQMPAHLINHRGEKVSGQDALGYPAGEWQPGDVVWSRFELPLPKDLAPGRYDVQVGLYDVRGGQRLPIEESPAGPSALRLGNLRVAGPERPPETLAPLDAEFTAPSGPLVLLGHEPPTIDGTELPVTLYWRANTPPAEDYTVFVQMLDAAGRVVAQSDSYPAAGALPTTAWRPEEIVPDRHVLKLPADLPPGDYRVIAGLYRLDDGTRLALVGGGDAATLGSVATPPSGGQ